MNFYNFATLLPSFKFWGGNAKNSLENSLDLQEAVILLDRGFSKNAGTDWIEKVVFFLLSLFSFLISPILSPGSFHVYIYIIPSSGAAGGFIELLGITEGWCLGAQSK